MPRNKPPKPDTAQVTSDGSEPGTAPREPEGPEGPGGNRPGRARGATAGGGAGSEAASAGGADPATAPPEGEAGQLVTMLIGQFREQVQRALQTDLDGSTTSLAIVDHYLAMARDEEREPILSLLAAGAGAYYGELVRRTFGATWIGRQEPRSLRLLLAPQLIHFSPVDQAFEAILGTSANPDDPRLPAGAPVDATFHLPTRPDDAGGEEGGPVGSQPEDPDLDDASWLSARLAEVPPMPEDQFHSLTGRFETLQLMVEMLSARHASQGRPPRQLGMADYLEQLDPTRTDA